jgi:DNA-binding transcriptional ArsR family regulator
MPEQQLRSPFAGRFGRREAEALAEQLSVLTNPTALHALAVLHDRGPLLNRDLEVHLGQAQSTVSIALARLRNAGLITRTRMSRTTLNRVDGGAVGALAELLHPDGRR